MNGWVQVGGKWYYLEDYKMISNCTRDMGNYRYHFNSSGVMDSKVSFIPKFSLWRMSMTSQPSQYLHLYFRNDSPYDIVVHSIAIYNVNGRSTKGWVRNTIMKSIVSPGVTTDLDIKLEQARTLNDSATVLVTLEYLGREYDLFIAYNQGYNLS